MKLLNEVSSKRVGFLSSTHNSPEGFRPGATAEVEYPCSQTSHTQENDLLQRYLPMDSSLSFIDLLEPSRALFYYYLIHGALFSLNKIFLFNAENGKSAAMSPQVTKIHVQLSHHVGILVPVPTSYYSKVFYRVFFSKCHFEHN